MKTYIANAYLVDNGKFIKIGDELKLRDSQAKSLGDKVTAIEVVEVEEVPEKEEKPKKETKAKKESK